MYGSSSQSHAESDQQPLLPSYSPVVTRREHGDAHVAPAWPATFEEGVDAYMASPVNIRRRSSSRGSFSEHSRILQPPTPEFAADLHGGVAAHGKMNYKEAVFNAINVLLGVGVLSSPFALRSSGMLVGVPLFFFFTLVTNHTGKLLGKCLDYQEGMSTYPDIGEAAFGTRGRLFIGVVFFSELFTACAMFNVLIGDTLAALLPGFTPSQLTVIAFLIIMPTLWTPHLSLLSYFSIIGILSSLFCLFTVFFVGFSISPNDVEYTMGSLLSPQPLEIVADVDRIPLAIGLTMVAFGGHSVFPSICSSMANRAEYPKVLDVAYFIVCLVYGAIEAGGYLMFGVHTTKELFAFSYVAPLSLCQQITLNLIAVFPGVITHTMIWTIALNPMSKIAITITPIALAFEEVILTPQEIHSGRTKIKVFRAFIRSVIGIATLFCALFVPHFARVTSFLGSFFAMLASVFLPCVCYIKLFQHRLSRWEIVLNAGLAVVSIFFAVIGTVASFISPAE
ncbi:Amino acid/auxin permease, partial [Globisporangium splendens]